MKRGRPLERRTPLVSKTPLQADPEKQRAFNEKGRQPLRAVSETNSNASEGKARAFTKPRPISPASEAQRSKCRDAACVVCRRPSPSDPAHLIDRSLGGDSDPRSVVPLCREHHRAYDEQGLDLLPYLEPGFREECAYAVLLVGLEAAHRRITNERSAA